MWEPKILVGRSETNHVVLYDEGYLEYILGLFGRATNLLEDLKAVSMALGYNGRLIREQKAAPGWR